MRPSFGVVPVAPVLPLVVVLLLVTGLSVAEDDSKNAIPIRLPTDITGLADLPTAMARATTHGDKERPWKCCDLALCTRSYPPFCWCMDKVDRCSEACEKCKETEGSEGYICEDRYHGDPGPRCSEDDGRGLAALLGVSTTASRHAAAAWKKDDEKASRPWKCCDLQACTRSQPPTCRCRDVVKRCAKTCKRCEKVEEGSDDDHTRYRCLDTYHGDPAPPCRRLMQRAVDAILRGYGY